MSKTTNPLVRIWKPLHKSLKAVAPHYSIAIGDFVSAVLFNAIFNDPMLIKCILMTDYDLDNDEAEDFLEQLRETLAQEIGSRLILREVYEVPLDEWKEKPKPRQKPKA